MEYADLMRVRTAAKYAGVSRETMYRWIREGLPNERDDGEIEWITIDSVLVDGIIFVYRGAVDEFLTFWDARADPDYEDDFDD